MSEQDKSLESTIDVSAVIQKLLDGFEQNPFHKNLGLAFSVNEDLSVIAKMSKQPHLMGNVRKRMLHGGAIAGLFDSVGGVLCAVNIVDRLKNSEPKARTRKLSRLCTVDLKLDYLRPARAEEYWVHGEIVKFGASIIVVNMALYDERNNKIAICGGNFMY